MPTLIRPDEARRLLVIEGSGVVTDADFADAVAAILNYRDVKALDGVLMDLSDTTAVEVSMAGVREAVGHAKKAKATHGDVKLAVVAQSDVAYGLARMYQLLRDDNVSLFRDLDDALAWLAASD